MDRKLDSEYRTPGPGSRIPRLESTHMSIIPTINDERGSYTRGSFALLLCLTIITTSWQGAGSVYAWTNHEGLGVIETFVQDKKAAKPASDDAARAMDAAVA